MLVVYLLILLIGLLPANNGFVPAENGIPVYLTSNAVHADIIVPISSSVIDWRAEFPPQHFAGTTNHATHVAFGWGDKGFFIKTPAWSDLKVSTAANALLIPSDCCMHVVFTRADLLSPDACSVQISPEQYEHLVDFINETFQTDETGSRIQIAGAAYRQNDAFFMAKGHYHALNTCNSWVGRALRKTGVRVPILTPMPKSPMLYLPNE